MNPYLSDVDDNYSTNVNTYFNELSNLTSLEKCDYKIYNHIRSRDLEKLVCKGVVAAPLKINKCIKHYISGIIDDSNNYCDCSSSSGPNHAVAIVGFGEDFEL